MSLLVIALAAFLRLYDLDLKPMHHDEGVNGFFLEKLMRQGDYRYDPTNYHGPSLYYLSLPFTALFGLGTFAVRLATATFGVATVGLVLLLRRRIGAVGALAAAALLAVSPGMVFYSRYFIHEMLFVFFTLSIVVAALKFYETGGAAPLMLASVSAALLFATKETAFISVGTILLAWLVAWTWARLVARDGSTEGAARERSTTGFSSDDGGLASVFERFGDSERMTFVVGIALMLFLVTSVLFYSSFFTYWEGVGGAIESLKVWTKTGTSDFHSKPFLTYSEWLFQEESPIFILAGAGSAAALFERRPNRFAIFAGAWGFGLLTAYSLIPYKTPWLMLSFILPMAVAAGYAVQSLSRLTPVGGVRRHAPTLVLILVAVSVSTYQAWTLSMREYDNDAYPYVYSHTKRETHDLVRELARLAERSGRGEALGVMIASPEYWPLPWYLRDYKGVGYAGSIYPSYDPATTQVVIGRESANPSEDQVEKLQTTLGAEYVRVNGVYPLRPGVDLVLFVRRDLAER